MKENFIYNFTTPECQSGLLGCFSWGNGVSAALVAHSFLIARGEVCKHNCVCVCVWVPEGQLAESVSVLIWSKLFCVIASGSMAEELH